MVGLARSEIKPDSRERCSASTALPDYEIVLLALKLSPVYQARDVIAAMGRMAGSGNRRARDCASRVDAPK